MEDINCQHGAVLIRILGQYVTAKQHRTGSVGISEIKWGRMILYNKIFVQNIEFVLVLFIAAPIEIWRQGVRKIIEFDYSQFLIFLSIHMLDRAWFLVHIFVYQYFFFYLSVRSICLVRTESKVFFKEFLNFNACVLHRCLESVQPSIESVIILILPHHFFGYLFLVYCCLHREGAHSHSGWSCFFFWAYFAIQPKRISTDAHTGMSNM